MTRHTRLAEYAAAIITLASVAVDASAATIRVECEARPGRAKISVDGKSLGAGMFRSVALSDAGNSAQTPLLAAVGGEVQTDYDSNTADIAAGATAVSPLFITGSVTATTGFVTGKIVDANGNTVISDRTACRVRTR